ncbi:chloride channel protein [Raineyella fluvialis]|uniref:H+/Cl-antiporter ClcA n=1 Tax=Raineyella fluvialis TaxID=2662261 RepID=A0A5Q2FCZ1_9ACTN|nr:chloride channel protein [Raineyella fluvialis]QGF24669.1 hypothetical protein Rai3103_14655 [Raineyella fluvialis]
MTQDGGAAADPVGAPHPARRVGIAATAVVLSGVAAGLVGAAMVLLLNGVGALAYGPGAASAEQILRVPAWRRVVAPTAGGLLAGLGWWGLRRGGAIVRVRAALSDPGRRMGVLRTTADALLQVLLVGSGGSIGREGAPRQTAAVLAQFISRRLGVDATLARTLLATAAGAGLAAVYNVPLAGALFSVEILRVRRPAGMLIAAVMSLIATVVAWPVVGLRATYVFPSAPPDLPAAAWALAAIPLTALIGLGFEALRAMAEWLRPGVGWRLPVAIAIAGAVLGLLSVPLPALPGNGKDIMELVFAGQGSILTLAFLLVLKPLVTTLYVRSGAVGGLLTPALATGAAAGGCAAAVVRAWGGEASVPVWGLVAAAGVLAVTQRAPLFAAAMAWELTAAPWWTVPLLVVVAYAAAWTAGGIRQVRRPRTRAQFSGSDPTA